MTPVLLPSILSINTQCQLSLPIYLESDHFGRLRGWQPHPCRCALLPELAQPSPCSARLCHCCPLVCAQPSSQGGPVKMSFRPCHPSASSSRVKAGVLTVVERPCNLVPITSLTSFPATLPNTLSGPATLVSLPFHGGARRAFLQGLYT